MEVTYICGKISSEDLKFDIFYKMHLAKAEKHRDGINEIEKDIACMPVELKKN